MPYVGGHWRRESQLEEPLDLGPYAPLNQFWGVFAYHRQVLTFYTQEEAQRWIDDLPPLVGGYNNQPYVVKPTDTWVFLEHWPGEVVKHRLKILERMAGQTPILSGYGRWSYADSVDQNNQQVFLARNYLVKLQAREAVQPPLFNRRGKRWTVRREFYVRRRR